MTHKKTKPVTPNEKILGLALQHVYLRGEERMLGQPRDWLRRGEQLMARVKETP